jgi:hypothetical protein
MILPVAKKIPTQSGADHKVLYSELCPKRYAQGMVAKCIAFEFFLQ